MKLVHSLLGTVLLCAVSFATPITLVDTFGTSSTAEATTGVSGTYAVSPSQTGVPATGYTRTTFVKKTGFPTSDTLGKMQSYVDSGAFTISAGSNVYGFAGAIYDITATDLTSINGGMSIDWLAGDSAGGALTFFLTSDNGLTDSVKVSNIINGGSGVAWQTFTTLSSAPQTFATSLSAILAANNNGLDIANVTGFGFFWAVPTAQDSTFDNFTLATPEPGTYALMGAGLAALAFLRRRK